MQLPKKLKPFVYFSWRFWILHKILCILKKKDKILSESICEIIHPEWTCNVNVKKLLFQNTLGQSACQKVPNTSESSTFIQLNKYSKMDWVEKRLS